MTRVVAVIPGRLESTRFPGKMLAAETGTPLIIHCAKNAARARSVDHVCIASDSDAIASAAIAAGIEHHMTGSHHANGTSRIAELVPVLDADFVVNVQGDEPELLPEVIDATVSALQREPSVGVATAASPIEDPTQLTDPAIVKVVLDVAQRAIYFSRSPIPFDRDGAGAAHLRHVGLYVYRPEALLDYVQLPVGVLEKAECLEQLRLLEHGRSIAVAIVDAPHEGIDTPVQYAAWVARQSS
ncbi:MAG: 3-deoxy-manno-octulosonate cytidylyltransferase [Myxococcota bacterium]